MRWRTRCIDLQAHALHGEMHAKLCAPLRCNGLESTNTPLAQPAKHSRASTDWP